MCLTLVRVVTFEAKRQGRLVLARANATRSATNYNRFINREELDEVLAEWLKVIEKWEDAHMGNYRRVYPAPGYEKYDKFYNNTGTLFSETAASRARIEQAK